MCRCFLLICMVLLNFSIVSAQSLMPVSDEEEVLTRTVDRMSLAEKVGQLFIAAFRQEDGKPVTAASQTVKAQIQKYHLGGVILFSENFVDIEQTVNLNSGLQQAANQIPLFIAVDQEGGRVNRFRFGTNLPGNMALGASGRVENAYTAGRILGQELSILGINTDLAPVLDINNNQDNPVIGIRSFSADPHLVSDMGMAYIQGLHDSSLITAVKHFPGHGDTTVDSHLGLPAIPYGKSRLFELELQPFCASLRDTDMIMAAHIAFPALDDTKVISKKDRQPVFLPASLSYRILTGLLRDELRFDGVIITDALEMKAIAEHFGAEEAVVRAIQAGADLLLMPSDLPKAYAGVMQAVKTGAISEKRINQSVKRILRLKCQRFTPNYLPKAVQIYKAQTIVGGGEHKEQEAKLAYEAVTLLKNEQRILPLAVQNGQKIVIFAPWQQSLEAMRQAAAAQINAGGYLAVAVNAFNYENGSELTEDQKRAIAEADYIVLGTYSATLASRTPGQADQASFAAALAEYADRAEKKLVIMAMGTPYDILYLSQAQAYLAVYGTNASNIHAGMAALFGAINPQGKLPVRIQSQGKTLFEIGSGLHY